MRWLQALAFLAVGLVASGVAVRLLNPLPSLSGRENSRALSGEGTSLARTFARSVAAHPGRSGIHLLADGRDAFAARVLLARSAERTIDAQYYIWHGDLTGSLLFAELLAAADRGVRVRLLLDDNNTSGLDPLIAELDAHPRIEVRLFNPFTLRRLRLVGWAVDFSRLNRRMHNKSFTIDNQATIIGGRNVGDEYFDAGSGALFVDLDALAIGPVVGEVSRDFDRYWSSQSAYPAQRLLPRSASRGASLRPRAEAYRQSAAGSRYVDELRTLPIGRELADGTLPLEWAPVELVSDDPAKALGQVETSRLLITHLKDLLGEPQRRLGIVSGYFVPTEETVHTLSQLRGGGASVTVVTNAFEATDVPVVHAGYADDRKSLLKAGVRLWELRSASAESARPRFSGTGSTGGVPQGAGQALHAKTLTVDGERLFIGSFNLDPRSARLNTELGFVIDSERLARRIESRLASALPGAAYQVTLSESGDIEWIEQRGATTLHHRIEPGTTFFSRTLIAVLGRLPIQWLL